MKERAASLRSETRKLQPPLCRLAYAPPLRFLTEESEEDADNHFFVGENISKKGKKGEESAAERLLYESWGWEEEWNYESAIRTTANRTRARITDGQNGKDAPKRREGAALARKPIGGGSLEIEGGGSNVNRENQPRQEREDQQPTAGARSASAGKPAERSEYPTACLLLYPRRNGFLFALPLMPEPERKTKAEEEEEEYQRALQRETDEDNQGKNGREGKGLTVLSNTVSRELYEREEREREEKGKEKARLDELQVEGVIKSLSTLRVCLARLCGLRRASREFSVMLTATGARSEIGTGIIPGHCIGRSGISPPRLRENLAMEAKLEAASLGEKAQKRSLTPPTSPGRASQPVLREAEEHSASSVKPKSPPKRVVGGQTLSRKEVSRMKARAKLQRRTVEVSGTKIWS